MIRKFLIFGLFLYVCAAAGQQDIQTGYALLENGQFEEAREFFKGYLESSPNNKSARICYGRALGLSGDPEKANAYFAGLLDDYDADLEVRLNYYESFLWAKEYEAAEPLYEQLVKEEPNNAVALLGYANTLANLSKYPGAMEAIQRSITADPENIGARNSRKYIRLGYAAQLTQKQSYQKAIELLKSNFGDFPDDPETIRALANTYLNMGSTDEAKKMYWDLAKQPRDSVEAYLGISLAEHLAKNDKEALVMAKRAMEHPASKFDRQIRERTLERYVQSLIWNRKFKRARQVISNTVNDLGDSPSILGLKATLGMYTGNSNASLRNYGQLLDRDSTSFDGNLGSANALFASDRMNEAYDAAFRTLDFYDGQKDATAFLNKLNSTFAPMASAAGTYSFDNGNNLAFSGLTALALPITTGVKTSVSYEFRQTENSVTDNQAETHTLQMEGRLKLLPKVYFDGKFGFIRSVLSTESYTQPVLNLKLDAQPYRLQQLSLRYERVIQNFNAELIAREIVIDNYGLTYNLGTNLNLGWYTQLMYSRQSDENSRNLLFTSLYYTMPFRPKVKVGLNYQFISFAKQVPTIYFSPSEYQAYEIFADLRGDLTKRTSFAFTVAGGLQKVENDPQSGLFRGELSFRHQFSPRLSAKAFGAYSNVASATAAGFEFTQMGVQLQWQIHSKPIFYKKLKEIASR